MGTMSNRNKFKYYRDRETGEIVEVDITERPRRMIITSSKKINDVKKYAGESLFNFMSTYSLGNSEIKHVFNDIECFFQFYEEIEDD